MYSMFGIGITTSTDDLLALVNAELVGHPIQVVRDHMNVLTVKIRETNYLNLKGHPVNTSDDFVKLVHKLAPSGYKVHWNNTGSCFWLSQV